MPSKNTLRKWISLVGLAIGIFFFYKGIVTECPLEGKVLIFALSAMGFTLLAPVVVYHTRNTIEWETVRDIIFFGNSSNNLSELFVNREYSNSLEKITLDRKFFYEIGTNQPLGQKGNTAMLKHKILAWFGLLCAAINLFYFSSLALYVFVPEGTGPGLAASIPIWAIVLLLLPIYFFRKAIWKYLNAESPVETSDRSYRGKALN